MSGDVIMDIIFSAIIVAIIIAIIIGVSKKKKKRKKIETTGTGVIKVPDYKGPPVNMIYTYPGKHKSVKCPFCDGENKINSANCEICGKKFDSRKRW